MHRRDPMRRRPRLAALLLFLASGWSATAGASARAPDTDEYVREAKSRVLLRAPTGSAPEFLEAERYDVGRLITVCGKVRLKSGETLPYLASWRRHRPLSDALVMAPLFHGETPRTRPSLSPHVATIETTCEGLRSQNGQVDPPSPSPPHITPAQYIAATTGKARAALNALKAVEIVSVEYAKSKTGYVSVCGLARAGAEGLPFASIWSPDEPLDAGGFVIAVSGVKTPAENPALRTLSDYVRDQCQRAGLGQIVGGPGED